MEKNVGGLGLVCIDEREIAGGILADWLRQKLLARGDTTERTKRLASGGMHAYCALEADFNMFARCENAGVFGVRVPGLNGSVPLLFVASIEPYLYYGERPLAVVCDANGVILIPAAIWNAGITLNKGDYCAILSAASVREVIAEAKRKDADAGASSYRRENERCAHV